MNVNRFKFWRRRERNPNDIKTVGLFTGYFFIINFVVGTGFLGIPFSFYNGGILAGLITLILVSFVSGNTAIWTVESMARAQAIESASKSPHSLVSSLNGGRPEFDIKLERKFEPSELAKVYYGNIMKIAYIIVLSVYCFLASWSFCTVAGSAWASNLPFNNVTTPGFNMCEFDEFKRTLVPTNPECLNLYRLCIFFYGVIVVLLSMLELTEQKILQIILGLLRFVTIGSMVVYSVVRLIETHGVGPSDYHGNSSSNETSKNSSVHVGLGEAFTQFNFNAWLVAIPIYVYSQITHQGIATLTAPVMPKKYLGRFFIAIIVTTCVIYSVLGLTVSMYWQNAIQETSTLNWISTIDGGTVPLKILSYFIVLFPSVDVVSAYPLMVVTVANNLYVVITGRDMSGDKRRFFWILKLVLKLVCAVLPLIASLFIANLVSVLQYAGLLGFAICYLFPILFQLGSQYKCVKVFGAPGAPAVGDTDIILADDEDSPMLSRRRPFSAVLKQWWLSYHDSSYWTPHSTPFSHPIAVVILSSVCCVLFALTVASVANHHTD